MLFIRDLGKSCGMEVYRVEKSNVWMEVALWTPRWLKISKIFNQNFSNSVSNENEIFSLNWCISKSFCRIWVAEVSKSKSVNKYLESENTQTIEQKAIVWWFVKQEYFLGHPLVQNWPEVNNGSNRSFRCTHFFISNSCMRMLYWDSHMAKKFPVLKPQKLRNLCFFFLLFFYFIFQRFSLGPHEVFSQHSGIPRAKVLWRRLP